MKQLLLIPIGNHTHQGAQALTRDGRAQMGLVAEMLRHLLKVTRPLLVCYTSDVGNQVRRIIADTLHFTEAEEDTLFETFDFMDPSDPQSLRLTTAYLKKQLESGTADVVVLLVQNGSIPQLDPAIQHLLWEHTTTDPKRCEPGHFLVYDRVEGSPVLH